MIIERVVATLLFAFVEVGIFISHPRLYRQSVRRARSFGRYPFHSFPRSANEKFLWRKVFDHDPTFVRLSDKLELRNYLRETGLDLSMTPVLWAGFSPHALPEKLMTGDVMIKANHDSGSYLAMWCNEHSRDAVIAKLEHALNKDFSLSFGEWGYKNVTPRVFAEKRIGQSSDNLNDLKFYTFGRRIERIVHIQDRPNGRFGQVFEPDGKGEFFRLDRAPSVCDGKIEVPLEGILGRAVSLARDLGAPFDHMRVDLLEAEGKLWLTEMTIYNQGGHITSGGADPDTQISRAWDLRLSWAIRTRSGGIGRRIYLGMLKRALDRANEKLPSLPPA
mgnify:CR=1 FL=1